LAAAGGVFWLVRNWRSIPGDAAPPPHRELWSKLLPFAAWTWVSSLMANLFVIADRYMIVHCSRGSASEALAQVGEYHSARVLPTLLVSIALILSPMITAHWSHDWEAGRRDRVRARLNLTLKLFGFGLAIAAVGILLAAPVLFRGVFQGKFAEGLAVLPWTLTYCVWFAAIIIAQTYLLCREKAYLSSIALFAGLVGNVGLNLLLLPRLGLLGAVLATTIANLFVRCMARAGRALALLSWPLGDVGRAAGPRPRSVQLRSAPLPRGEARTDRASGRILARVPQLVGGPEVRLLMLRWHDMFRENDRLVHTNPKRKRGN